MSASEVMMAYSRNCRDLTDKEIEALVKMGVPADSLGFCGDEGMFKLRALVVSDLDWLRIDMEGGGNRCVAIVCRDERGEVADLAAWSPRDDRIGLWFGAVTMLGEEACGRPRLGDDKLWVRESVLDWLIHRRTGVVIINAEQARPLLTAASPVAVKSKAHRDRLEAQWRAPRIQVFDAGVAESTTEAA